MNVQKALKDARDNDYTVLLLPDKRVCGSAWEIKELYGAVIIAGKDLYFDRTLLRAKEQGVG